MLSVIVLPLKTVSVPVDGVIVSPLTVTGVTPPILPTVRAIVPAVVICICLLLVFFPDSFRAKHLRYQGPPPAPAAEEAK